MQRITVGGLRRLALGAALVVILIIVVSYGWKSWQAARARRMAPPAVPTGIRQQAAGFTFTRSEKGQPLFTIRASRTRDFKENNRSLLEDVWITIYGKQSNRSDHIHTDRCDYDVGEGLVACGGEVVIDLEGSLSSTLEGGEAVQRAARRPLHIETSDVSFNQSSGIAHTDRAVRFSFQLGSGRADGLTYDTRAGVVELQRNIEIQLHSAERGQSAPIVLRGSRLHYNKADRRLALGPPLSVTEGERQLTAQNLSLYLDEQLQAQRAEASGTVNATSREAARTLRLTAAQVVGLFGPRGAGIDRMVANGAVHMESKAPEQNASIDAQRIEVRFDPARREAREIQASGDARFEAVLPAERRLWSAPSIVLAFRPGGRELARGHSEGESLFEIIPRARPNERRRMTAQRFDLEFGEKSRLENVRGAGGVRVEVLRPGQPTQTSSSDQLFATFQPAQGTLQAADQIGHFRAQEADRQATAERAHYEASTDTATLVGEPRIRDSSSETTARLVFLNQKTGEVQAQQNVRTTYFSSSSQPAGQVFRSGEPVHIAADRLHAQRASGQARYEGHCRIWQAENLIQADVVELYRNERKVVALGKVASLFLDQRKAEPAGNQKSQNEQRPVSIKADRLTYFDHERRAIYEGSVAARDGFGAMRADQLQVFFNQAKGNEPLEIERALAIGKVVITQPGRRARSEEAEYFADEDKVVLSGGTPTIEDEEHGSTTGRRLTFWVGDDRILVDSEEGLRTLTKHRVAK